MRVISGRYGTRRLKALSGDTTRPTTDKVKESMFNIIGPYFDGGTSLDLYAGSGGLSIEAVSRGIDRALLFEKDRRAQKIILENIAITKEEQHFHVFKGDWKHFIHEINDTVDIVFLDPPYAKQTIEKDLHCLIDLNIVGSGTIVVCETDREIFLPEQIGLLKQWKRVVYGTIAVSFYQGE